MSQIEHEAKTMPENVEVHLMGQVTSNVLFDFYKTHSIHLFVHLSETEGGVPLALQEAASFGIPLLGTNAGGIPEIVNENTGILLECNVSAEEIAAAITNFSTSQKNNKEFRSGVRNYWKQTFDKEMVYAKLYSEMTNEVFNKSNVY